MNRIRNQSQKVFTRTIIGTRNAAYEFFGVVDRRILKQKNHIVIFAYHSIAKDIWRFSVDPKSLQEQIIYLKKHYDFISLKTLQAHIDGKVILVRPSVVLTFDDGYKDIITMKPFFKKHNITPALFVLANNKTPNWKELGTRRPLLTNAEIKSLAKLGWEIGLHSDTHANLATLSKTALYKEIVLSKKSLEKSLGIKLSYFAYPRGKYNADVLRLVKEAKYAMAFTMDDGFITYKSDMLTLPRVGIDRTHSFTQFQSTFSPSVVMLRKIIKNSLLGRYL